MAYCSVCEGEHVVGSHKGPKTTMTKVRSAKTQHHGGRKYSHDCELECGHRKSVTYGGRGSNWSPPNRVKCDECTAS